MQASRILPVLILFGVTWILIALIYCTSGTTASFHPQLKRQNKGWLFLGFGLYSPHDRQRVATFTGTNQTTLFECLHRIAICRCRTHYFIISQPAQHWVGTE